MKIVFAGTPEFAATHLEALLDSPHTVVAAYTQPDRPAGRGRKAQPSAVKSLALSGGIPVEQPASLRTPGAAEHLRSYRPDLLVVVAYGLILPPDILNVPPRGCINSHASLLPRWRGAAPIQRAIEAGDDVTGISVMQMDAGLDTGPVLLTARCPINATDTAQTLHDRLAALGAGAVVRALDGIAAGTLRAIAQDADAATYAAKINKDQARIDWQRDAAGLARMVRAFNPWPVAQSALDGATLRIWAAEAVAASPPGRPGLVVAAGRDGIDVLTGDGVLRLLTVQRPGARALPAADFLNAVALTPGRTLLGG